jgi:small-conductance mechanosensitive channel
MNYKQLLLPLVVLAVCLVIGLIARGILLKIFQRWANHKKNALYNSSIEVLKSPSIIWIILLAIYITLKFVELPSQQVELFRKAIEAGLILSIALVLSSIARAAIVTYGARFEEHLPITTLTQNLSTTIILSIGGLMMLNSLGIPIAPILTTLGIGGLAVALALQDTLSNLFAGIYIILSKNIRGGDYIKLDSGDEGYITDITTRVTKIRTLSNNVVIIPNQKISQAIVTNFCLPDKRIPLSIPISISYEADIENVEQILMEEIQKAAAEITGLLSDPAPSVRLIPGFGENALNLSLNCVVNEFTNQYSVQHELRKRILKRFKQEGIEIPYPQRVVYLKENLAKK